MSYLWRWKWFSLSVDVIGVCKSAEDVSRITTKTSREVSKRALNLIDTTGKEVAVTLWGEEVITIISLSTLLLSTLCLSGICGLTLKRVHQAVINRVFMKVPIRVRAYASVSVSYLCVCSCVRSRLIGFSGLLNLDRSNHSCDLQECFGPESLIWDGRLNNSRMCMKWHYSSLSSFNLQELILLFAKIQKWLSN